MTGVAIELSTPNLGQLGHVVSALRGWQHDGSPMQLHPGDLGWNWRSGAEAMAAALRIWSRDGQILAVGFVDSPEVLRMTVAPGVWREKELADRVVADVSEPARGVLPAGKVSVEAPDGTLVRDLLSEGGWSAGEPWTPLRRDLTGPVDAVDVRIEAIGPERVSVFTAVHRSAWGSARFTDEKWHAMAAGLPFADARCLLAYDDQGIAVAGITVWSAGRGRPGLIEPLGVHAEHRRRGYAKAICVAAAAELKELGSSSALVCTPSSLVSAVATYKSAGFHQLPERLDQSRDA
jgi:ribosomal protein S18 acetylase RimI-like enzyme